MKELLKQITYIQSLVARLQNLNLQAQELCALSSMTYNCKLPVSVQSGLNNVRIDLSNQDLTKIRQRILLQEIPTIEKEIKTSCHKLSELAS